MGVVKHINIEQWLICFVIIFFMLLLVENIVAVKLLFHGRFIFLFGILMQEKQPFERIEVTREQALELFSENNFKAI